MFISKEELEQIQLNLKVLNDDLNGTASSYYRNVWSCINALERKIKMLMDYLNLEIVEEPEKKYIRKKVKEVQKKS